MNAKELKQLRQTAGLSQEGLARKLNISVQTVARWESGKPIRDVVAAGIRSMLDDLD